MAHRGAEKMWNRGVYWGLSRRTAPAKVCNTIRVLSNEILCWRTEKITSRHSTGYDHYTYDEFNHSYRSLISYKSIKPFKFHQNQSLLKRKIKIMGGGTAPSANPCPGWDGDTPFEVSISTIPLRYLRLPYHGTTLATKLMRPVVSVHLYFNIWTNCPLTSILPRDAMLARYTLSSYVRLPVRHKPV